MPILISGQFTLRGMLDSGSMSCTLSEEAKCKLKVSGVVLTPVSVPERLVLVACGGLLTPEMHLCLEH